jgi:hypothetical protein
MILFGWKCLSYENLALRYRPHKMAGNDLDVDQWGRRPANERVKARLAPVMQFAHDGLI